jgi:hypothetical protein
VTAHAARSTGRRLGGFWVLLFGALVLLAFLVGRPPGEGTPLDPSSPSPAGVKGMVLLLEELGAEVTVADDVPAPGEADVVLVLQDLLDDDSRAEVRRWTIDGGRLVVADPYSLLTPELAGPADVLGGLSASTTIGSDTCDVEAVTELGAVDVPGAVLYLVPEGASSCYGDGEQAFLVVQGMGDGVAVAVGGAGTFTNTALGEESNASLAGALLAPEPGSRVVILEPPTAGAGEQDIADVVAPGVPRALVQLCVAFLIFAWWRARRLGQPVREPQPVQLEGSELVAAVGHLLQQNRTPQAAADLLRHDLRRTLEERLGVPKDAPPDVVAALVAARTGLPAEEVGAAVTATPVQSEGDLVEVAKKIETIRGEVLHGPHP